MEHCPPDCFFPEERDSKGNTIYKKNLIKVPSCDIHNSQKSGDDVYALFHLSGLHGVNRAGELRHQKLARIISHDLTQCGGRFEARLRKEVIGISAEGMAVGKADGERMQSFLRHVAMGVYFYETFEQLTFPLKVTNLGNGYRDEAHRQELQHREVFFDGEMRDSPIFGENPEVFKYSIKRKPEGHILIRLVFYGNLKHWVFYYPTLWTPNRNDKVTRTK